MRRGEARCTCIQTCADKEERDGMHGGGKDSKRLAVQERELAGTRLSTEDVVVEREGAARSKIDRAVEED